MLFKNPDIRPSFCPNFANIALKWPFFSHYEIAIAIQHSDRPKKSAIWAQHSTSAMLNRYVGAQKMPGPKKKTKHFRSDEDVYLARAWVNISENAAKGADMTSHDFWSKVAAKFNQLAAEGATGDDFFEFTTRERLSLENRWKRIRPKVSLWVPIMNDVETNPKSGENEEQMLARAHELYQGKYDEEFRFYDCYEVLKESPKFGVTFGTKEDEDSAFSNIGCTAERPSGQKSAKKKEKRVRDAEYRSRKRLKAMEDTAAAAAQMAASAKITAAAVAAKQKFDQDRHLLAMYREMGDNASAMELLAEMKADRASQREKEKQLREEQQISVSTSIPSQVGMSSNPDSSGGDDDSE